MLLKLNGVLAKGKEAIVDDEDFEKVNQYKWHSDGRYAIRYLDARVGSSIRLHRFIMNARKGQQIDHINRNPLDNRKENLRFCTSSENNFNRTPKVIDFKKYRVLKKIYKYKIICRICQHDILPKQTYYDGQKRNRVHTNCVVS